MSDRPSELEFKLNNILLAVCDVAEWFNLGLQLGLPSTTFRLIAADPNIKDIKSQRLAMLSEWLKHDTAASWEKLAAALTTIGENVVAANVRSQFMKVTTAQSTAIPGISEDVKTCQEMKQNVLRTIKCRFATLLLEVRSAMEAQRVKLGDVHQFLLTSFQGECHIPEAPDLTKIFNTVTESKLWCYDNYIPLKKLAEKFLPDDDPVQNHITEYRSQLSGFYTTTKIIDFIDLSKLEDAEDNTEQPAFIAENYKKHYRKLTLRLKLERKVKLSNLTLDYVDTLWKALIEEFNLPPLTAVIDEIVSGSLIVSWLVPPQVSNVIAVSYSKALGFYQQHNIVLVELDDRTLYDVKWIGDDSNTALITACQRGHVEATTVLLEHEINVNYQAKNGQSALWWASYAGETECVKVLVKYGAQVDLPDKDGNTALIKACRCGHVETARVLLDNRANVDHQNKVGETALIWACYKRMSETVSLLLKAGAKTDLQEKNGETALWWAAWKGYVNIVQMLIDYGSVVDLGRNNTSGTTGLMLASECGRTSTVRVLLEAKADPNITTQYGDTALHLAARKGHVEEVKMLMKYGAAVDIRNKDGETALHKAALRGHVEVVKIIVDHGAAVDIRNKEGLTALDVARGYGHQAVCEALEQYIKQETRTELTEEQRESIYQRLLKMAERIFLKEQVKKREDQQKEHHHQEEEKVRGEREKRSLWSRLRRRRDRPGQTIVTIPTPEK